MSLTIQQVQSLYKFEVLNLVSSEEAVRSGKCSQWSRRKELKNDKDVIYLSLSIEYLGNSPWEIKKDHFHAEDSEGYFNEAVQLETKNSSVATGEKTTLDILFSLYQDVSILRLWLDTQICYENTQESILLSIPLPKGDNVADLPEGSPESKSERIEDVFDEDIIRDLKQLDISPQEETEVFIREISSHLETPYRKAESGYQFRIALPDGRKQTVFLNFTGQDDQGNDLVTIGTICASATEHNHDRKFLMANPKMAYGTIGISQIRDGAYYVVTDTYPVSVLTQNLVTRVVKNIAAKGDWLEEKLTGGMDIQ